MGHIPLKNFGSDPYERRDGQMKKIFQATATVLFATLMMLPRAGSWAGASPTFQLRTIHAGFSPAAASFVNAGVASPVPVDAAITIAEATKSSDKIENTATKNGSNLQNSMQIVIADNKLSVSLTEVDLEEVLKEISRQTNVKVFTKGAPSERVTLKFINLPLEEGFKRILKNQNYSFIYLKKEDAGSDRTQYVLSQVTILGSSTSGQADNKGSGTVSKETPLRSPGQPFVFPDISAETINRLLTQDPQAQEDALKTLSEAINSELPTIIQQLQEVIQQSGELGENSFPPEVLEKLLPESEMKNIQQ